MNPKTEIKVLREETHMWPASANVFLIRDREGAILIDVGCGKEEKFDALKEFLKGPRSYSEGCPHHSDFPTPTPDHMGAMRFLLQEISPRIFLHGLEIPLAADPWLLNQTFDF